MRPDYFFPHLGFAWVPILPDTAMYALFAVMSLCSVLITLGLFYRLSSVVFALLMTYTFVIDKAHYLNHHYLMCLLSWCMALLPANRAFALDCVQHPDLRASTIPAWTLWLLRFHIAVPYFFGGIAKFDADWLSGRPMELTLSRSDWHPLLGPWTDSVALIQFFTWGGLLFDLLVVPGLLWKPTRGFAFAMCLLFHLTNSSVFTIGVFPWLMIAATALFFPPDWPRRLFARRLRIPAPPSPLKWSQLLCRARAGLMLATVYVAFHCLFPLRHLLLDREANWTERGHFFAWHMLLREKRCGLRVYAVDRETREVSVVDARPYVTRLQLSRVSRDPEMIRQLAHHIHRDLQQSHGKRRRDPCAIAGITERPATAITDRSDGRPQPGSLELVDPGMDHAVVGTARGRPLGRPADAVGRGAGNRSHRPASGSAGQSGPSEWPGGGELRRPRDARPLGRRTGCHCSFSSELTEIDRF